MVGLICIDIRNLAYLMDLAVELEEKTKQTNDRKLAAGLISQNAYQSATYSYESASVAKETAAMSLLQAQLAYQWAVGGLASTQ